MSMMWQSIRGPNASMVSMPVIALPYFAEPQSLCLAMDASAHPNPDTLHYMKVRRPCQAGRGAACLCKDVAIEREDPHKGSLLVSCPADMAFADLH